MINRILHLTYDMGIGGTEQVIKNLVDGSDPELFEMSIFCIEEPIGPFGELMLAQGTPVTSYQRQAGFDLKLIKAIRKHIKQNAIDILHCHQYTPWAYGALATIGDQCKVVFTEHGRFYPDRSSWKRKLVNPLLVKLTSRITAISAATKKALTDYEFIPQQRIDVIYNGLKPLQVGSKEADATRQELGIPASSMILGTIARLDPIKNHAMMLRAFARVLKDYPDTYLLIVGDGEERTNLEQLINQLDISSRVILTGYINTPGRYLSCMDIFLLSSLSEGTSMTLLEAMSLAKPCVVTDAGGNPEIVLNNDSGLVTDNENETQFADAISLLLSDKTGVAKMGATAKQKYSDKFSARAMCSSYASMYRTCLETVS